MLGYLLQPEEAYATFNDFLTQLHTGSMILPEGVISLTIAAETDTLYTHHIKRTAVFDVQNMEKLSQEGMNLTVAL